MLSTILAASPLKPEFWLDKAGSAAMAAVALIIFAESGMLIGFFFPGDSMLFFTGFLTSNAARHPVIHDAALKPLSEAARYTACSGKTTADCNAVHFAHFASHIPALPVVLVIVFVAAVAGDQIGYFIGKRLGKSIFSRPNSKIFRPAYLEKAHAFFEKNGSKSIVLARFVPIVRTFTPVVAGAAEMPYREYLTFDLIGGFLWAVGVTSLGHFLGQIEFFRNNIEYTILAVILISLSPVIIEVIKHRRAGKPDDPTPAPA